MSKLNFFIFFFSKPQKMDQNREFEKARPFWPVFFRPTRPPKFSYSSPEPGNPERKKIHKICHFWHFFQNGFKIFYKKSIFFVFKQKKSTEQRLFLCAKNVTFYKFLFKLYIQIFNFLIWTPFGFPKIVLIYRYKRNYFNINKFVFIYLNTYKYLYK